jgi:hypothetical protein
MINNNLLLHNDKLKFVATINHEIKSETNYNW